MEKIRIQEAKDNGAPALDVAERVRQLAANEAAARGAERGEAGDEGPLFTSSEAEHMTNSFARYATRLVSEGIVVDGKTARRVAAYVEENAHVLQAVNDDDVLKVQGGIIELVGDDEKGELALRYAYQAIMEAQIPAAERETLKRAA